MSPAGSTAAAFERLARRWGIDLRRGHRLPWLTNRGHEEQALSEEVSAEVLDVLRAVFCALEGDQAVLAAKDGRPLRPDFLLGERDQLVELDEAQHFTTARLRTLDHYPDWVHRTFDVAEYRALCSDLRARSDRDFGHRGVREFPGRHGRQRQRAYFDVVRDLAAPAFGHGAVIRIPAPDRDAEAAAKRLRRLLENR